MKYRKKYRSSLRRATYGLLYLGLQNDNDIPFYIDCEDGGALDTMVLYNRFLLADVCTIATGLTQRHF
jgi:hypothetical protein